MEDKHQQQATRSWSTRRDEKKRRMQLVSSWMSGPLLPREKLVESLEALIAPADRIVLEGDNQKQADFLSRSLAKVDPEKLHDLHLIISSISRPEHLTLFELGIAKKVDFAFAGPQSPRVVQLLEDGVLEIGAIHTYVELYARLLVDLTPNVVLVCAEQADSEGNLYTGPGTEDTPVIVEAAAFHDAIVIVQANRIVEKLPRVDIPSSWVDVVVESDRPYAIEPLFTRDPRQINDLEILMGMMVIRGIYERHQVRSLNHGIGFDTAAIELLLPTYGESLGLRGKICEHWALNPHPTLIPAIESGWVNTVYCFGSEVGMEDYIRARPDIFFTGRDGSLRSNRVLCQLAGQYAVDAFIGSTLQIDGDANSSTVTSGRIAGFGGAPNMGHDPHGRRHSSPPWLDLKTDPSPTARGRTPDGTILDPDNLYHRYFRPVLTKAGLRKIRLHDLRHTFGSLLIQSGASIVYVKEQMGHSSIQVTVDTYGHLIPGANVSFVDRLDADEQTRETTLHQSGPGAHQGQSGQERESSEVIDLIGGGAWTRTTDLRIMRTPQEVAAF
jgi:malonate decarboxylase alpha subunit